MKELIPFVVLSAVVTANICTGGTGNWSHGIAHGVIDFAHGGVSLSKSSNCFDGCLATGFVVQNFKVALADKYGARKETRKLDRKADRVARFMKMKNDDVDPNAMTCIDQQLRDEIGIILGNIDDVSCKGIVKALVENLNRPDWMVNCVNFDDFGGGQIFQDTNFCAYLADKRSFFYDLRLAKIDSS